MKKTCKKRTIYKYIKKKKKKRDEATKKELDSFFKTIIQIYIKKHEE